MYCKLFPFSRVTPRGVLNRLPRHTVNLLSLDHGMVKTFSFLSYSHVMINSDNFVPGGVNERLVSKGMIERVFSFCMCF